MPLTPEQEAEIREIDSLIARIEANPSLADTLNPDIVAMPVAERQAKLEASRAESAALKPLIEEYRGYESSAVPVEALRTAADIGGNVAGGIAGFLGGSPSGPGALITGAAGATAGGALARQGTENLVQALDLAPPDQGSLLGKTAEQVAAGKAYSPGAIFDRDLYRTGMDAGLNLAVPPVLEEPIRLMAPGVKRAIGAADEFVGSAVDTVRNVGVRAKNAGSDVVDWATQRTAKQDPLAVPAMEYYKQRGETFWQPGRVATATDNARRLATEEMLPRAIGAQLGIREGRAPVQEKVAENFLDHANDLVQSQIWQAPDVPAAVALAGAEKEALMQQKYALAAQFDAKGIKIGPDDLKLPVNILPKSGPVFESINPLDNTETFIQRLRLDANTQPYADKLVEIFGLYKQNVTRLGGMTPSQAIGMMEDINLIRRSLLQEFNSKNVVQIINGEARPASSEFAIQGLATVQDAIRQALKEKTGSEAFDAINRQYAGLSAFEDLGDFFMRGTERGLTVPDPRKLIQGGAAPPEMNALAAAPGAVGFGARLARPFMGSGAIAWDKAVLAREPGAMSQIRLLQQMNSAKGVPYAPPIRPTPPPVPAPGRTISMGQPGAPMPMTREAAASMFYGAKNINNSRATDGPVTEFQPGRAQQMFPRSIGNLDPQTVEAAIVAAIPDPLTGQPLIDQYKKIYASGDKAQMGQFIGLLASQHPNIPFQKGPVTGLPSEIVMENGRSQLFLDADRQRWQQALESSNLEPAEKALRTHDLMLHGYVYPMQDKLMIPPARPGVRTPTSPNFTFSPRSGGRRINQ